jgi:DNA-binding MarR family transcriptional regulator
MARLTGRELRAWQALLHAHHDVTQRLDAELKGRHGITLAAYDVLLRLARAPDHALRMSDLAERVMAPPSSVTRRVDRLVADGLVERGRAAGDSREMVARLTEPGRRLLLRAARTHLQGIRKHYTGRLSEEQLEAVAEGLEVISGPHRPH